MNEVTLKKGNTLESLRVGQIFSKGICSYYMLSRVDEAEYCLISLIDGNRWENPCSLEKIHKQIMEERFEGIPENSELTIKCG